MTTEQQYIHDPSSNVAIRTPYGTIVCSTVEIQGWLDDGFAEIEENRLVPDDVLSEEFVDRADFWKRLTAGEISL